MMERVRRFVKNLGVNQKFVFSLSVFLIIPLIVLLFIVNYNVRLGINRKTCETNLEVLKQTSSGIQNFVNDAKLVSLNIGTDADVQELIRMYNGGAGNSAKEKQRVDTSYQIQSELKSRSNIRSISIYNRDEIIYQYGDYVFSEDRSSLPLLDELGGIPLWTGIHNGETTSYGYSYSKIYLLRAIKDLYTFEIIAYERISIDESTLREQYLGIIEPDGLIFITAGDGLILSASQAALQGQNITAAGVGRMPQESSGYTIDGDNVVSWYSLDEPGWKVIKVNPAKSLFRNNQVGSNIIFACIVLTIIFGIFFVVIQRKTIITPIVTLSQEAKNFRREEFKMPLCTDSDDEIGKLNQNLSQMVQYIQDLILNQYQNELKRREIELKYMQSQINPHFLYNTLDSIRWMAVMEGQTQIAEQVEALSDIFRHALSGGKDDVTLEQEIEHLKSYILIQKNRFGERLQVDIEVEAGLSGCRVLKLILQPLVENAIVHGIEKKLSGGRVKVTVSRKDEMLVYCVEDDGVGTDEQLINAYLREPDKEHNVFALKNIDERIKLKYGEQYGLIFTSKVLTGTRVEVHLPVIIEAAIVE